MLSRRASARQQKPVASRHATSCTDQHGGYLGSNRLSAIVPSSGRIVRIRVKSGPNPARLRLTILTSSARIDTTTGRDIPETCTCRTAVYVGKAFRPRPNATTVRRVNDPVRDTRSQRLDSRTHATDSVAISASGPGTVPLGIGPDPGGQEPGTPISQGFWSATKRNEPRVDGYGMTGIDVLLGWDFRRGR
jgi:hypothetical protein